LDVWLWVDPANAKKVITALHEFGFGSLGLTEHDFLNPVNVLQLGYPPVRIDLTMSISGVEFDACFSNKVDTEIDGIPVSFIGLEDLKINKRASARLIDLDDVENLS
jgi:hypothetical protein